MKVRWYGLIRCFDEHKQYNSLISNFSAQLLLISRSILVSRIDLDSEN